MKRVFHTLTKEEWKEVYARLDRVTPIDGDCGALCGSICCQDSPDYEMVMYLLPGEDKVHNKSDPWLCWEWDDPRVHHFPKSFRGPLWMVDCTQAEACNRKKRPVQCRTFPVAPHLTLKDELILIWDNMELPYVCPLLAQQAALREDFMETTLAVWEMLCTDRQIYDIVRKDSRERRLHLQKIMQVYPSKQV